MSQLIFDEVTAAQFAEKCPNQTLEEVIMLASEKALEIIEDIRKETDKTLTVEKIEYIFNNEAILNEVYLTVEVTFGRQ